MLGRGGADGRASCRQAPSPPAAGAALPPHLWPRPAPRCGLPPEQMLSPSCHVWLSSRESRRELGLLPVLTTSRDRSPLPDRELPGCCRCQSNDIAPRGWLTGGPWPKATWRRKERQRRCLQLTEIAISKRWELKQSGACSTCAVLPAVPPPGGINGKVPLCTSSPPQRHQQVPDQGTSKNNQAAEPPD